MDDDLVVGGRLRALTSSDMVDSDDEEEKVISMGKASLKLLVTAIVAETGKWNYLATRNMLQKPEYVGRDLTRDEKTHVADILEEVGKSSSEQRRPSLRVPVKRSAFPQRRVSLEDLCRDPTLHSAIATANNSPCPAQ